MNLKDEFISSFKNMKKMKDFFPKNDINFVEFMILNQVNCANKSNKRLKVSDLDHPDEITKPAISQNLNNLEKKGYLTRSISANDRRAIELNITKVGMDKYSACCDIMDVKLDKFIEGFGEDNLKTFIELLNSIGNVLDKIKESDGN